MARSVHRVGQRSSRRGHSRALCGSGMLSAGLLRGSLAISPMVALLASPAWAGPEGEQVAAGSASFHRAGPVTTIHAGDRTIINYSSFNIGAQETVRFVQPHADARVLNRIQSATPTQIDGALFANGRVYIANPAGVIFGEGSVINAAGIVAAAGRISDSDFLRGVDRFTDLQGEVINHGAIYADTVHLLGRHVANFGTIEAKNVVTLLAGDEVLIGERGGHIYARMNAAQLADQAQAVSNNGTMLAAGDVYSVAIHDLSSIRARSVQAQADMVKVQGTIDASAHTPGQRGGRVEVLGDRVAIDGARIDVSGHSGGGTVRIGGGLQGGEGLRSSEMTMITPGSSIKADALVSGDGGNVVIWSDHGTAFLGEISAAGAHTGNGGFVEVSGKHGLYYRGSVHTTGGKAGGRDGTLLLDPLDITIVPDGTGDAVTLSDVDSFLKPDINTNGNEFPNEIEASVIEAATSDVILQAERDITFNAALNLANDGIGLTAEAGRHIIVNESIITRGGDVRLVANASSAPLQQDGSLTINAPIDTTAGGILGGTIDLVVDGGVGRIFLGADLSTDGGAIAFHGPTTIIGLRTLDTAGTAVNAGSITFDSEIIASDATAALDLDARAATSGGNITLNAVGGAGADVLSSLDVRNADSGGGSGTITLEGDVLTGGTQRYEGFVVLGSGADELRSQSGEIQFLDALSLGSGTKTLAANDVDFAGSVVGNIATPPTLILLAHGDARVGGGAEIPGTLTLTTSEQNELIGPFAEIVLHAGNDLFVTGGSSAFSTSVRLGGANELILENGANLSTVGGTITLGDGLGDVRMVGGATVLVSTGLAGGDIVINPAGALRTSGDVSDGSLTLSAGSGDIIFDADVGIANNAPGLLRPVTSGELRLNDQTTRAVQLDLSSFSGPIVIGGDVSIVTDNVLDLTPASGVLGAGPGSSLSLTTPLEMLLPSITLDGALTLNTASALTLAGDISVESFDSSGVNSGVVLANDVALTVVSSGVDFSNATGIDGLVGGEALSIDALSATLPAIGQSMRLGDVTLVTTNGVTLLGNVWTQSGDVDVSGPLSIAADLAIDTNGGAVNLSAAEVNGSVPGWALTIDATGGPGAVALSDVGQSVSLGSLEVIATSIELQGSVATSTSGGGSGLQRYTGATTINGTASLFSTNGLLAFVNGFTAGATNVTLAGDEIDFGGAVSGTGLLELFGLPDVESFRIGFAAPVVGSVNLSPTELAFIQSGFSQITIGRPLASVSQAITLGGGSSISFNNPVVLRAPTAGSSIVVDTNTQVDHSGLLGAFIQIIGSGATTTLRSGSQLLTNNAPIFINDSVLLDGPGQRTLSSNGGAIDITGDVNGFGSLRINAGTGLITLLGNFGSSSALDTLELVTSGGLLLGESAAPGTVVYELATLDVDALTGPITLRQSWDLTVTSGATVDLGNTSGIDALAAGVQSARFSLGTSDLILPAMGLTERLGGIEVASAGLVTLNDSLLVTGGAIDLGGASAMRLVNGPSLLTISALNGTIALPELTGARGLRLEATGDGLTTGLVQFGGVAAGQPDVLTSLVIDAAELTLDGSIYTSGLIDLTGTPSIVVTTSVVIDSDPSDAILGVTPGTDAGNILFSPSGVVTAVAPGLTVVVDATADGGGASGSIQLPGGFFQGFGLTQLIAGLIHLDESIFIDGDVEFIGRVEQSASVTIDTNIDNLGASGSIRLDQAVFHATSPGFTLTLDTSSSNAQAGDIWLMESDDFFGSASFLAGVTVEAAGSGGPATVFLSNDIDLDATAAGHGLRVLGGADVRLTRGVAIRTNALLGGNAGTIDLSGSTLVVDVAAIDPTLLLDASASSGTGADILLGAIDTSSRRFDRFEANTRGSSADGRLRFTGGATVLETVGDFIVTGRMEPDANLTINTLGGQIDLSQAIVSAGNSGVLLNLLVSDTTGGDGRIFLGGFDNRAGVASFLDGVQIDTVAASDGTLTLLGDVRLSGTGGFGYSGAGMAIDGQRRIDTHQAGGMASGDISINSVLYALTAGSTLILDTSTPGGVATTGNITTGDIGDNSGADLYLTALTIDTRGDGSGEFSTSGTLALDGDLAIFGIWRLQQNTAVLTNADGVGVGGQARFTNTAITDGGSGHDLSINTAGQSGFASGDVLFGDLASYAGSGVEVRALTINNGGGVAGTSGLLIFRSDDNAASTLDVDTLTLLLSGDIVIDVPFASITTADTDIDLSSAAALRSSGAGFGRLVLDAGTASIILPASVGQGAGSALGGLDASAGTHIQVNGSIATSTAGGHSGAILLSGPIEFTANSTLSTTGSIIDLDGPVSLLNGSLVRLQTTASGSSGATITLRGDVTGQTASSESLVLYAGQGDLQLYASIGDSLIPLALLELISSGRADFGPISGIGASYYANQINAAGLTGNALLRGDTLLNVSGTMALDLGNLAFSGGSFGINGVTPGGQSLVIEAPLAQVFLPSIGQQTALGGLRVDAAQAVTLRGSIATQGGDVDLAATADVQLDAAGTGPIRIVATDGDILFDIDGAINGFETLILEANDTTGVTPRTIRVGAVGTSQHLEAFELTSDMAELWGDLLTDGGDIGLFANIDVRRSITIDTDGPGGVAGAGSVRFGQAGETVRGVGAGLYSLLIDVTADGPGQSGTIDLPVGFFQDFASVELRAGEVLFAHDIIIDGDFSFVGNMRLANSISIDTNADNLGNSGNLDLSQARVWGASSNLTLTINTATEQAGFASGRVDLGEFGEFSDGVAGFHLSGLTVIADSFIAGTIPGNVYLHDHIALSGSLPFFVVESAGLLSIERGDALIVDLNPTGTSPGTGGLIDLRTPTIVAGTAGAGLRLLTANNGEIELGAVDRIGGGLSWLELNSFGGRNRLYHDISINGPLTISGALTLVEQTLTIDTDGAQADLTDTVLGAGTSSVDLTIRTAGGLGTGVLRLGGVNNTGGAFSGQFLKDLTLEVGQRLELLGDIRLATYGVDTGDFEVISAGTIDIFGSRTIDTHQGSGNAGRVLMPVASQIRNGAANASLTINTSAGTGIGGQIVIPNVVGLSALTLDTTGSTDGIIFAPASININGPMTVRGSLRIDQPTRFSTNHSGTGNAGQIDLSRASIYAVGAGRTLVLDASASSGAGGNILLGRATDSASGQVGQRLALLGISANGSASNGNLVLDRPGSTVLIDVAQLDLDGSTGSLVYGPLNGALRVARSASVSTDGPLNLAPVSSSVNTGAASTTLTLLSRGTAGGGITLPAGGVGSLATPFGSIDFTANGNNSILALGNIFTAANGGSTGDVRLTGLFTYPTSAQRTITANGGTVYFSRSTPTTNAVNLNRGTLTVRSAGLEIVGLVDGLAGPTPRGEFIFEPLAAQTIGLGDGVTPSLDILISRTTLGSFGENIDRVLIGTPGTSTGTPLIEVGTFDIASPLTLRTRDTGNIDLLGTVVTTSDELRLQGPARVRSQFSFDSRGSSGNQSGGDFVVERTLNGTTQGALLNGRRVGTDQLVLNLGTSGDAWFNGNVGATTPLGDITINRGRDVYFSGSVHASSLRQGASAGTADNGTGTTLFGGTTLFTGPLGLILETANAWIFGDLSVTGGAGRLTADVILGADVFSASQSLTFDRTLLVLGERSISTTLPINGQTNGGTPSAGGSILLASVDGEFDSDAVSGDARLRLTAGTAGDITVGLPANGGFAGGVGQVRADDLLELRIVSADELFINVPTRVGTLVQDAGRQSILRGAVTTFANGPVTMTTSSGISVLGSIASDGPVNLTSQAITLSSNITTTADAVRLTGATGVTQPVTIGTANGPITFAGTLNATGSGQQRLTLNAGTGGDILFEGVVGGIDPLDRLTIVQARNITARSLFTVAELVQTDTQDLTLFEGGLSVLGVADLNGNRYRLLNSASFGGDVTITNRGLLEIPQIPVSLAGSFTQDGTGASSIGTSLIAPGGSTILFSGPVSTTAGVQFGGETVTFLNLLNAGGNAMAITADDIVFGGGADSVSGTNALVLMPRNAAAPISLGSPENDAAAFALTTQDLAALRDGFASITIGRADGAHAITIGNAIFRDPTTLRYAAAGGNATIIGSLTGTDNASFNLQGSGGSTALSGDITTQGQPVIIDDTLTLASNAARILTSGGPLLVTGAINALNASTGSLLVDAGLGAVEFRQPLGGTLPLQSFTLSAGQFDSDALTTSGNQAITAAFTPGGDITSQSGSIAVTGPTTLTRNTQFTAGGAGTTMVFDGTINGGFAASFANPQGQLQFLQPVGGSTPLTAMTVQGAGQMTASDITAGSVQLSLFDLLTDAAINTLTGGLTVINSGTWQILPGASFSLAGPLSQSGQGSTAISTNITSATDMLFGSAVELRADSVTLTSPNIGLLAGVRTDGTPRALVVNASQIATLSGDLGTDANPLSGFSPSGSGRVDLNSVELVSLSGVRFDQPVIVRGDSIVHVLGNRPGSGGNNSPAPIAQRGNRQPLSGISPDSIVFTDVIVAPLNEGIPGNLTLLVNLDATGGLIPKIFLGNDVGRSSNSTSGLDLSDFGALTSFYLNADPRFSPVANIPGARNGHTSVPLVATIIAPTDITIETIDTFRMGINEKFTILGSLFANSLPPSGDLVIQSVGQAFLGDITAADSVFVNSPQIFVLSRSAGLVLEAGGVISNDLGTDVVAANQIRFNGLVSVLAASPTPGQFTLATSSGGGTSSSLFGFSTRAIENVSVQVLELGLDLRSEGSTNTNVSQAIAGAVPRASEGDDVTQAASVSAAQKDLLQKLGIFARDASDEILLDSLTGRSIYADYNTPDAQTRRQEVTAQRLDKATVDRVVDVAQRLLFLTADASEGDELNQPMQVMREALNRAVDAWAQAEDPQEWNAASLLAHMRANPQEHADAITSLQVLDEVLRQVELIGLSPGEVRDQRSVLLGQVRPVRLKLRQFYELVQLSRSVPDISVAITPASTDDGAE